MPSDKKLGLWGPAQQAKDLARLTKLGKQTWNNLLSGAPAALDPETWRLIDRNRRILTVFSDMVDRMGPSDPKTASYNKMLRHMIKASQIITGPKVPDGPMGSAGNTNPPDIPDWDP